MIEETSDGPVDLGRLIRQRREDLFGPKPTSDPELAASSGASDEVRDQLEALQAGYEMELGAHRDTTSELLRTKDRLINHLEETIKQKDRLINEQRERIAQLELDRTTHQ